ncbi:Skp1 family, dimerization domain-containing protein [Hypoxylon rubiginosum]|uniref:Skp1 family, dimerization domain-containing protein n=1 Tax=Hypoxylon rubiginosum TaxID=110542 RepID=A0ACC0CSX0_9PEZI|nr:Skp1 family, dimerization domain-containing protein [Hypoxylon rubiginosum]
MSTLTLISNDAVEVLIGPKAKTFCQLLVDLTDDLPDTEKENCVPLAEVDGDTLRRIVDWCEHHAAQEKQAEAAFTPSNPRDIPEWDTKFLDLEADDLFEITRAANYMNVEPLLEYCVKTIAKNLMGMTTEQMQEYLDIEDDFTPEEKEQIMKENEWAYSTTLEDNN